MLKVLIVDDQPEYRLWVREFLDRPGHYTVAGEANDGEAAVRLAEELQPDLIIMDVQMPGMTGVEAAPLVREACPQATVVLISVYDEPEYRRLALAVGAKEFISKKRFNLRSLEQVLRR